MELVIVGFSLVVVMATPVAAGDEWLAAHSLHTLELTLEHVLERAKIIR